MATIASLQVKLDFLDNLSGGLAKARGSLESFGESARKAGESLTTKMTLPLVGLAVYGVKAASDLQESMSAAETTFGTAGASILRWSEDSAQAFGISQAAALTAATQYGAFFRGVGEGEEQAAEFSTRLVQAAADLSSFWNVPTGQSLSDLQSGLAGQYEPLLKYGIVLNEAVVQQQALTTTGKTAADQLTQQEIIAARYTLILNGLGAAEGDRARTADSFSNQMRTMTAEFTNAAAKLGTLLLPMLTRLVGHLTTAAEKFQTLSPGTQKWVLILGGAAAAIGPLLIGIGLLIPALSALGTAMTIATGPIGLIVIAIAGLVVAYQTNFLGFADGVNAAIDEIVASFNHMVEVIRLVAALFVSAWQATLPILTATFDAAKGIFSGHIDAVKQLLDGLVTIIKGIMQVIKGIFTGDWGAIKEGVTTIVTGLKDAVMGIIGFWLAGIKAYLDVFKTVFDLAWNAIKDNVGSILGTMWANIIAIFAGIKDTAYSMMVNVGTNIGQGMIDGVNGMWDSVVNFVSGLVGAAISAAKEKAKIWSPSREMMYIGKMMGAGLVSGIEQSERLAEKAGATLARVSMPMLGSGGYGDVSFAGVGSATSFGGATAGRANYVTVNQYIDGAKDARAVADEAFALFSQELRLSEGG